MSNLDRLLLFLHIGFAIFSLGPLTAVTMATPRYVRKGDLTLVRYLNRATRIYGLLTLGIVAFGLLLADGGWNQGYLTASLTLFIVAAVLLLVIERDQRKAVHALGRAADMTSAVRAAGSGRTLDRPAGTGDAGGSEPAADRPDDTAANTEPAVPDESGKPGKPGESEKPAVPGESGESGAAAGSGEPAEDAATGDGGGSTPADGADREPGQVERGRIATISGLVALIWLAILALMIWGGG